MPNAQSLIPRILITNDDGIHADGLAVLERIARKLSKDIWVAAPEMEQSGAGHSLTLHLPVRVRKINPKRYAISGTPTDCVLLALNEVIPNSLPHRGRVRVGASVARSLDKRPPPACAAEAASARRRPGLPPIGGGVNLLLSGVNRGSNVGDDVTYSGTVAAAMEGTILGVPSIAFSQLYDDRDNPPWKTAETFAPKIIRQLLKTGWPQGTLININFPQGKVKGIRVCPQGKRLVNTALSERVDPKGRPYYWIGGERNETSANPSDDITLLQKGYITVTPISLDMTDYKAMDGLNTALTPKRKGA